METSMFESFLGGDSELCGTPLGTLKADLFDGAGDKFSIEFFDGEMVGIAPRDGIGWVLLDRVQALEIAKLIINQLEQGE